MIQMWRPTLHAANRSANFHLNFAHSSTNSLRSWNGSYISILVFALLNCQSPARGLPCNVCSRALDYPGVADIRALLAGVEALFISGNSARTLLGSQIRCIYTYVSYSVKIMQSRWEDQNCAWINFRGLKCEQSASLGKDKQKSVQVIHLGNWVKMRPWWNKNSNRKRKSVHD